jgi:lactate dehydrogenase-like 2-hydroxyacid dehydrogenase
MVGKQVTGARLGIIGIGRVGRAFAAKARGFDMEIHYYNRSELSKDQAMGATYHDSIESLLGVADFLSLHCPATPETTDLMNADRFALLPQGAVIVNTARGALIDEQALLDALGTGQVSAAGLDCFKVEPGGNPAFAAHDTIFMLPHIGSATRQTRDAMGFRALDNLDAFFAGQEPRDLL